jgi:hypothetical protein
MLTIVGANVWATVFPAIESVNTVWTVRWRRWYVPIAKSECREAVKRFESGRVRVELVLVANYQNVGYVVSNLKRIPRLFFP